MDGSLAVVTEAALPEFRYHPDPLATGSAVRSEQTCDVCGLAASLAYDGPLYGRQADVLCLRCIASGRAARALGVDDQAATFTDVGWGVPDDVPESVLEAVSQRTPGFRGWQQEHWMYHCGDAAAFLGRVGHRGLLEEPGALEMVLHENDEFGWTVEESEAHVQALTDDGEANAYLFRCLHCGAALAYTDMS